MRITKSILVSSALVIALSGCAFRRVTILDLKAKKIEKNMLGIKGEDIEGKIITETSF